MKVALIFVFTNASIKYYTVISERSSFSSSYDNIDKHLRYFYNIHIIRFITKIVLHIILRTLQYTVLRNMKSVKSENIARLL